MGRHGSNWGYVIVAALVCLLALSACGGGTSDEELEKARAEGAQEAKEQAKIEQLEKEVQKLQRQNERQGGNRGNSGRSRNANQPSGGGRSGGGPTTVCQDNVSVGPNTSCAFAMNVAGEYGSNPGASTIRAYSPVTERFYVMNCSPWSGGGTVCTGGNGAAVYIR